MLRYILAFFILSLTTYHAQASEILDIRLHDGVIIQGKLELPQNSGSINKLVVFVPGTGPNTYLNKRKAGDKEFVYYDLWAQEFNKRGIALFTYNRRGVTLSNTPPMYDSINQAEYAKYSPETEAMDVESIIRILLARNDLQQAKIILLGGSEGTIISAMVADRKKELVDALFMFGYAHDNVCDIIKWQLTGGSSMVNIRKWFDQNKDKAISRAEYEADSVKTIRERVFQNAPFASFDLDKDSILTTKDFALRLTPFYNQLQQAIRDNNNDWIWKNFFKVNASWVQQHCVLEPNKTRLLRINIPIFIFQGKEDANVPYETVYDLQQRFKDAHKSNLTCFLFDKHDHDLNFTQYLYTGTIPEGLRRIFDTAGTVKL